MVYTEEYAYVVCGSMSKLRDRKTSCHAEKEKLRKLRNCPAFEIAPPYLNTSPYALCVGKLPDGKLPDAKLRFGT